MKKPFLLLSLLLTFGLHADCAAWGTVGHRAIAEVAQRHLTPKAKAAIERYTGSTPLAEYAVFMDEVAADPRYKEPFRGWLDRRRGVQLPRRSAGEIPQGTRRRDRSGDADRSIEELP